MFSYFAVQDNGALLSPRQSLKCSRALGRLWAAGLVSVLLAFACPPIALSDINGDSATAADELPDELRSGQARFHLLTGDPFAAFALNPQPESRQQKLLQAQALIDMGLYRRARNELESLADSGTEISAAAGLELIRLALRTDDLEQARRWLDRFLPRLQGENRQEALFHQAELLRKESDLAAAAATLKDMGNNTWTGLGYFNLAADYARADTSSSRPLVALRVATSTAGKENSAASLDLVDRANLGGGLLALRAEDYRKAINFLSRVRLDSYQAPLALYLHGLAELKQQNVRGALQSWHRARKFPLAFAGAAEAYIAMGQAYDEAGSSSQAADAFLTANAVFEKEQAVLQEIKAQVQKDGSHQALLNAAGTEDVEWFLADSQTVTAPRLAWLVRFLEDAEAQRAVQRLAELERMDRRLRQKQAEFDVLRSSVAARVDAAESFSAQGGIRRVTAEVESLAERLAALKQSKARPGTTEVERQLQESRARVEALAEKAGSVPSRLSSTLDQVEVARRSLDSQLQRIAALRTRSEAVLDDLILGFIAEQVTTLEHLADRSEQEIARLYEYMAVSRLRSDRARESSQ
ncbi:hypothetical protein [Hydrocarboniclastica marina]|uniref:Tetratricopeptide repeat protein n=1 Tax=Hydrocarboniclastica marina TaxID=2259620 RepID=A0A4P7XHU9_9ALTE|nr:hypothetical protein [Hydrocarboniclastica marina]MAL97858.1 hypothetical protein [Alteromonadaceae bacterium]QCF26253.1 hypothetical protein soil367_10090 [Hydrocarboniclastica marina]